MYQLTADPDVVLCIETGYWVSPGNEMWDRYQRWLDDGGVPDPVGGVRSIGQLKSDLATAATAARWERETGGILIDGVRVGTTLDDQNRLTGVLAAIQLGGLTEVDFKAQNGWVKLTASQLQGISQAISAHVQACFSAERAHHEAIAQIGSVAEADSYDLTVGWPPSDST